MAKRGNFTVLEGLDGSGKGVMQNAIVEYEMNNDKRVYDGSSDMMHFFVDASSYLDKLPNSSLLLTTEEPSHYGIGLAIREEIIKKNSRKYSANIQIQAYSLDRLVQIRRLVLPFLEHGNDVVQARNVASSLCYQVLAATEEGMSVEEARRRVMEQEGNMFSLENSPDLLIISMIKDFPELMKRLDRRDKKDNSIFENLEFQKRLKPFYEDTWLKELFESHETKVSYLDAGISVEETARQALEIYTNFYDEGIVMEKYHNPN